MIEIGVYNELEILRETSVGLFLGDDEGADVLLPNKYLPETYEIGDRLEVFVYLDYDERKIATTLTPAVVLHEFALLQVADVVSEVGTFMQWGLEKHLLVPFSEQRQKLEQDRWYIIYLDLDTATDRLYGSNKLEKFLDNEELTVTHGEEVELVIYRKTELGYSVIINHQHKGLVYDNEVFRELRIGDRTKGYVKLIREENKVDISLHPIGYENFNSENSQRIYSALVQNAGFVPLNDKSDPEDIYQRFQISKKAFKKAVGDLYRQRRIMIEGDGIRLVETEEE